MTESVLTSWVSDDFDAESIARSRRLPEYYKRIAEQNNAFFLDAGAVISADDLDGIHMNAEGHSEMAKLIYNKVQQIFQDNPSE